MDFEGHEELYDMFTEPIIMTIAWMNNKNEDRQTFYRNSSVNICSSM